MTVDYQIKDKQFQYDKISKVSTKITEETAKISALS